jgi:hypothetical protein
VAGVDAEGRPDTRGTVFRRHGPGERAAVGIEPSVLAAHVIPSTIPFTAADLEAWLLDRGFATQAAGGRLLPTVRAVEIIAALD